MILSAVKPPKHAQRVEVPVISLSGDFLLDNLSLAQGGE